MWGNNFTMNDNALINLDAAESAQLTRFEERIGAGLASFIEVGEALGAIRDRRLYRATHGTFEDYCREKWGMSDRRARQLMTAAEIGTMVPVVTTERQARELARVEPDRRQEVVEKASVATGGKITAAAIREAASEGVTIMRVVDTGAQQRRPSHQFSMSAWKRQAESVMTVWLRSVPKAEREDAAAALSTMPEKILNNL